jgi:uncharacterized protein HemY
MDQEIKDLQAIAAVYKKRGKLALATQITHAILQMQESYYGHDSSAVAKTLSELGDLYCDQELFEQGRAYLTAAADLWHKHHPERTDVILFADTLARLAEQTSDQTVPESPAEGQADDEQAA